MFNVDETGLNFRVLPAKSVSSAPIWGFKKPLSGAILAFAMSAKGEKLSSLTVGNASKPRAFYDFNTSEFVDYAHPRNSWTNSSIFHTYLEILKSKVNLRNRKILLRVDNCPTHKVTDDCSNVKVLFLPPDTTDVLQPLDLGIIGSLKCKFRKFLARRANLYIENVPEISIIEAC